MDQKFKITVNSDTQKSEGPAPIELRLENGEELRGSYLRHEPACVVFATADGERRVPLTLIPDDLRGCFPADPIVALTAQVKKTAILALEVAEQTDENDTIIAELTERVRAIEEHNSEIARENEELRAVVAALQAENTALMRSQGETE